MGQIISFRRAAAGRASRAARPSTGPGGEAEILFFLGVRYCREEDGGGKDNEPNLPSSPRSRRKKRA